MFALDRGLSSLLFTCPLALLAFAPSARAQTSPLLLDAPPDGFLADGTLTLSTSKLPAGWFTGTGGSFDRGKTILEVSVDLGETSCSDGVSLQLDSAGGGAFAPTLNPAGAVNGWNWSVTIDLADQAEHFAILHACDGNDEILGCTGPRPVTVTVTAYAADGSCRTYGAGVCASDSASGGLLSVQDPDVSPECVWCEIGACVSECQAECTDSDCASCCECWCKDQTPSCEPQPLCFRSTPGHPRCLYDLALP